MGVNSLPKTVTRQRLDCDLNTGPFCARVQHANHSATEPRIQVAQISKSSTLSRFPTFSLLYNEAKRNTCIPPGSLNRVPASAGVRAGMSPLPGGRQHCVIPCGMWVPVAVWQLCELLYTCYLLTYLLTLPCETLTPAKQAVNDSVATYLKCGGVVNNQIKKGLLLSLPVKKNKFKIGEYLAKLHTRTWLSRALSSSVSGVLARRAESTRRPRPTS